MLIFCAKCGIKTEQSYVGMSLSPSRIVTRCNGCRKTNFTDSWEVHNENRRIKQNAIKAKLEEQISRIESLKISKNA